MITIPDLDQLLEQFEISTGLPTAEALDRVYELFAKLAAHAVWQQEIIAAHSHDAARAAHGVTRTDLETIRDASSPTQGTTPEEISSALDAAAQRVDALQTRMGDDKFDAWTRNLLIAGARLGLSHLDNPTR
jgi:hypothetical protein